MDEKAYKITLADGTILENLSLNGNNFISASEVDASIFESNCCPITINDGTDDDVHENMELVQVTEVNDKWWFVLRDISAQELAQNKMKSDIEYIAMMSDIEL